MPESSGQGKFAVVRDEDQQLMTFALDHQGLLCLIFRGSKGHNELANLSQKFGFSAKRPIRTLAASQNVDGTIHLVFALQQDVKADQLYVLRPMTSRIADCTSLSGTADFYTGPQWDIHIREILLASSNDGSGPTKTHPQLHLVFEHNASEKFGKIMGTYNSASKAVVDTLQNVEEAKKVMANSLAELITLLRTWPMPQPPSGG
ncbi:hypothetical protein B0H63DRAFT_454717 [Podospora didyma]|uniref:Uncharacterized protein n=1 Tax=Podospora didyma TaxID=330526 RepID=A0AAE0K5P1_9PEZI|nr:hypothetical protein B0H63DRAFT_454717 [Podospora didyma]